MLVRKSVGGLKPWYSTSHFLQGPPPPAPLVIGRPAAACSFLLPQCSDGIGCLVQPIPQHTHTHMRLTHSDSFYHRYRPGDFPSPLRLEQYRGQAHAHTHTHAHTPTNTIWSTTVLGSVCSCQLLIRGTHTFDNQSLVNNIWNMLNVF